MASSIQINDDLMWKFTDNIGGRGVDISSKKQFNTLLKANGLVHTTREEPLTTKPKYDKSADKAQRSKMAGRIMNKLKNEGLAEHIVPFMKHSCQPK